MVDIQKADPVARKRAVFSLIAGLVAGLALFILFRYLVGNLNDWLEVNALFLVEHHYIVFLVMLLLVFPILWLSIYLIHFAGRIVKTERFPPHETPVIRDVRVLEGRQAILRGRLIQGLCWIILMAAATIPVLVWYIFYSVSCIH